MSKITFNTGVKESLDPRLIAVFDERLIPHYANNVKSHDLLVYCGLRTGLEQNRLYVSTRTSSQVMAKADSLRGLGYSKLGQFLREVEASTPKDLAAMKRGINKTNATAGEGNHTFGCAFDAVPMVDSKPVWDYDHNKALYDEYGGAALKCGLDWSGSWKTFQEYVHCQLNGYRDSRLGLITFCKRFPEYAG